LRKTIGLQTNREKQLGDERERERSLLGRQGRGEIRGSLLGSRRRRDPERILLLGRETQRREAQKSGHEQTNER